MDLIDSLAQSIATMEGYFKPNTIAQRNNNPGNLRSWGSTPTQGGYAVFATAEEGWAALRQQVQRNVNRGLTLEEFFGGKPGVYPGYAPSADSNNPTHYAQFVAGRAGIPANQPITAFLTGAVSPVAAAASYFAPSWDVLPAAEDNSLLIYGGIAALAIAAVWLMLD